MFTVRHCDIKHNRFEVIDEHGFVFDIFEGDGAQFHAIHACDERNERALELSEMMALIPAD